MSTKNEVKRLATCGLISKDEYVIDGFAEELDRMMSNARISEMELVGAINSLIDSPAKDHNGEPRFVTTSHIKSRVDYNREQETRRDKDEKYQSERKSWAKDFKGVPECWKEQERYLGLSHPTEADKQRVLDAIREEMVKHPNGSEMYSLWMKAGKTWKEVRV